MNPKFIPYTIILILLYVILFLQMCKPKHKCPEVPSPLTTITTIYDTLYYPNLVPVPYIEFRDTGDWYMLAQPIDTSAIIHEFFTRNVYQRTLVNDSNALITLTDTVFQNKLCQGYVQSKFYSRTQTIHQTTTITEPQRPKLFLGAQVSLYPIDFTFSPSLLYQTRTDHIFAVAYNPFNKDFLFSTWWKLRFYR